MFPAFIRHFSPIFSAIPKHAYCFNSPIAWCHVICFSLIHSCCIQLRQSAFEISDCHFIDLRLVFSCSTLPPAICFSVPLDVKCNFSNDYINLPAMIPLRRFNRSDEQVISRKFDINFTFHCMFMRQGWSSVRQSSRCATVLSNNSKTPSTNNLVLFFNFSLIEYR